MNPHSASKRHHPLGLSEAIHFGIRRIFILRIALPLAPALGLWIPYIPDVLYLGVDVCNHIMAFRGSTGSTVVPRNFKQVVLPRAL